MKKNIYHFLLLASASIVLSACGTHKKIAALRPDADYKNSTLVYQKETSTLNLPLEITLSDLQNQVNKNLNGLLYEDKNIEDDNLTIRVFKQAPIVINDKGGKIHIELPMKIEAKIRYGIEKFGISAYDTREIKLNGTIKLNAGISINNWKLATNTDIEGVDWAESPTVSILGKDVPFTYFINPALALLKSKLAKIVDENLEKSMDLRPYVFKALDQVVKPMELSKDYQAWLGISPTELFATNPVVTKNKISIGVGMKSYIETSVGRKPTLVFDKTKLKLQTVDKIDNTFSTNIAAFSTYEQAAALVTQNFAGKKFESGKYAITINKVEMWGKNDKMIIALNVSGSINGDIYLQGIPVYNVEKQEISIDEIDFVLDSKQSLLKMGDWLLHGLIVKKIQENCKFSIAAQLADGQKMAAKYLTNYEPVKGVKINGSLNQLAPNKIFLTPSAIVAMIIAKGNVSVKIEGLQ
ncbi:MAG: DUF4403 family protein [Sphingobacteriaceae bacterium]|nr:DUF4403 family protein [Sphingobacteriaceae bacterium]